MSKRWLPPLLLLLLAAVALATCQRLPPEKETPPTPVPTTLPIDGWTIPPANRTVSLLDTIIMVEEPSATVALDRLEARELDLYAAAVSDPQLFARTQASAELGFNLSYGTYYELTFNTAGPLFTATQQLNPFAHPRIREAMNYLIDRDYIVREICGGLAVPRFTAINTWMPDYARMAGTMRGIERKYAYNPEKAEEIIDAQMTAFGATFEGGKWMYNGQPATLIFLIRTEDERRAIGDYVADRLESVGFTVDRRYKSQAEAMPIWQGEPALGQWNIYTGGWVSFSVSRDLGSNFYFFYATPWQKWQETHPSPPFGWPDFGEGAEFREVERKLYVNDFQDLQERAQLLQQALVFSLEDSMRIFLVDRAAFTPHRSDISVATGLSSPGGRDASLWALTLRREGDEGGSLTVALPRLLTGPWNGLAGSDQVYDEMPQQATAGAGVLDDPYTGLPWPQRIEKAEVVVQTGLPVTKTLDWLTLQVADRIDVPDDAWVDWDPVNQTFITADQADWQELSDQPWTPLVKVTVYYPAGMYQAVKWHDGSPLSAADFVLNMILTFDRTKPESALYDPSTKDDYFPEYIKGIRILSVDPLVIETYTDLWYLDAEYIAEEGTWWPQYGHDEQPWHTLALGILAESDKKLAFSQAKAAELGVEWASFIGGPSLDILKQYLDQASSEVFVPYAPTLARYLAPGEAATRYANLTEWVRTKGHFWVGTGPYYLDSVSPAEHTLVLKRFPDYPDPADKWLRFSEPRLATARVSGPDRVSIGQEATFEVAVTFQNKPYPIADAAQVNYTIWNSEGQSVATGPAEAVADGRWRVYLDAGTTAGLAAGLYRIGVAVSPKAASFPASGSFQFAAVEEGME